MKLVLEEEPGWTVMVRTLYQKMLTPHFCSFKEIWILHLDFPSQWTCEGTPNGTHQIQPKSANHYELGLKMVLKISVQVKQHLGPISLPPFTWSCIVSHQYRQSSLNHQIHILSAFVNANWLA